MKTRLLIFVLLALPLLAGDPHFGREALFLEGAAPSTPASGQVAVYAKTDGKVYRKDDAGAEAELGGGAGGGGVTISSSPPGSPAAGDLWWDSDIGNMFVYYNDGATSQWVNASLPGSSAGVGRVAQVVIATTTTTSSGTAAIPLDGTTPQNTEGFEVLTGTITPTNPSSTLIVEFMGSGTVSTLMHVTSAIFRDSEADCINSKIVVIPGNDYAMPFDCNASVTAGTTAAQTFKVRVGQETAVYGSTLYFLRRVGSATNPTGSKATLKITEILPEGVDGGDGVGGGGRVAQVITTEDGTQVTTTASFPSDNTIPQNTEGGAYAALDTTFTPSNPDSTLYVEVCLQGTMSLIGTMAACLFVDSTADALASGQSIIPGNDYLVHLKFQKKIATAGAGARTYKVRFGGFGGSTACHINGASYGQLLGGTIRSYMKITEILPGTGGRAIVPVQDVELNALSTTSTTYANLMDVTVTPSSSTQKFLLRAVIQASAGGSGAAYFRLTQDGTFLSAPTSSGSRDQMHAWEYATPSTFATATKVIELLVTPGTTNAVNFAVQWRAQNANAVYVNRTISDTDTSGVPRLTSTFTVTPY
jgi:hypothetical protein